MAQFWRVGGRDPIQQENQIASSTVAKLGRRVLRHEQFSWRRKEEGKEETHTDRTKESAEEREGEEGGGGSQLVDKG